MIEVIYSYIPLENKPPNYFLNKTKNKIKNKKNSRRDWQTYDISKRQVSKIIFNHLEQQGYLVDRKRGSYMDECGIIVDVVKK